MQIQKMAWVFAIIFLAIGILGFVPGVTVNGALLGIFEVDMLHNVIHIATGVLAAVAASMSAGYSRLYFQAFGVIYAVVAIAGLVQGDTVLGIVDVNLADNILHVGIAAVALYFGFGMRHEAGMDEAPAPAGPGEPMV